MEDTSPVVPVTPVPRQRGMKKLLKIGLPILLVLAGASVGGWWWMNRSTVEAAEPPLADRGLLSFEPFLVNLADAGGTRFLKVNVQLVLGTAEEAKHVQETPVVLMELRSAILEILTQQSASALVTAPGKQALKAAIKANIATLLKGQKVIDVLFSEFVVQF
jgi:flagellar FliL protein